ncbi:hypothetical protein HX561_024845, partial [Escherichia coli]|nr:hypothetical protein [Escherichia coli]
TPLCLIHQILTRRFRLYAYHQVVYPEVLSLVFDAANTYNAEPGVLEQTAQAYIESHGAIERHLGCSDF